MEKQIESVGALLLVAAVVAILARRLGLPYMVGLVLAGVILKLSPLTLHIQLTKELLFALLLPPLIFEAALALPWRRLRCDLPVILVLATLGVVMSAGVTSAGMHYFARWSWAASSLFGVLIAATDPVSVIAAFKEAGVRGRLRLLVESESLLNDGTAAVLLAVVLAATGGASYGALNIVQSLVTTVIGGIVCGALVAGVLLLLAGHTDDHLIVISFTAVAAYGSFMLAEHLHVSGVIATLAAGLLIGNTRSLGAITERGRDAVESFWEYVAFVVNSLIFLLIGVHAARHGFDGNIGVAAIAVMLVVAGRALSVYSCCALFSLSASRVEMRHQHIIFWAGLRGALALALALGLPESIPEREAIRNVAFAVVAFSVFVQGLTMTPLLRKMRVLPRHGAALADSESPVGFSDGL